MPSVREPQAGLTPFFLRIKNPFKDEMGLKRPLSDLPLWFRSASDVIGRKLIKRTKIISLTKVSAMLDETFSQSARARDCYAADVSVRE